MRSNNKKSAIIMVDVDSWQTQLAFYGYENEEYKNDVYENSLPRLVTLLDEFKIKGTFFIVGKHAKIGTNRKRLKKIAASGHELASHSMSHLRSFSKLDTTVKEREIKECTSILQDIAQQEINGFRAPDYDIDSQTIDILIKYGYSYDASFFPTFMAIPMKIVHFFLAGMSKAHTMGSLLNIFSPILPYKHKAKINFLAKEPYKSIIELPLTVTPFLRLPFYGTSVMAFGQNYFDLTFKMLKNRPFINYTFHAFELADAECDNIDQRLFRHPGIKRPFKQKWDICKDILKKISQSYDVITATEYIKMGDL